MNALTSWYPKSVNTVGGVLLELLSPCREKMYAPTTVSAATVDEASEARRRAVVCMVIGL